MEQVTLTKPTNIKPSKVQPAVVDHDDIPADERWLHDKPEVLKLVQRGLADSAAGRVYSLPSIT